MQNQADASRPKPLDVPLAMGLAMLAGATDIRGLDLLRDLFVSFMSGNTTLLGRAVANGDWQRASMVVALVGCFVLGAVGGSILHVLAHRWHATAVLFVVCLLLALPLGWPPAAAWSLTAGMGMLNETLTRLGSASVSLTYVTGTLVKFGQGVGRAMCGRPNGWTFLWQVPMWLSLLAGVVGASLMLQLAPQVIGWLLPTAAAVLLALSLGR